MKINHIGYACKDILESLEFLKRIYKINNIGECVYDKNQEVNLCLVDIKDSVPIELVSGEKVNLFVDKGVSIYHVCYECEDINSEIEKFKANGATLISRPVPAELFGGNLVAFLSTNLGIVELLEKNDNKGILTEDMHLLNKSSYTKGKVAISASFTVDPIKEYLLYLSNKLNYNLDIDIAPYNQIFQQLLNSESMLKNNKHGFNVILLKFEDWVRYLDYESIDIKEEFEKNAMDLINAIREYLRYSLIHNIIVFCPPSPEFIKDIFINGLHEDLEEKFIKLLSENHNVHFIKSSEILFKYKIEDYFSNYCNDLAHIPYNEKFFSTLAIMIMRKIQSIKGYPYKVIVLDCDDTLWSGICGEVGYDGILLAEENKYLQEFMLRQVKAGMLICLCSKNNENDVMEVFDKRQDMIIKTEHLTDWRINWEAKSENLKYLAQKLDLGLNSFIFIDDNPYECAEVASKVPDVTVIQLPKDKKEIPSFLERIWIFDHDKVTEEDKNRTIYYKQNVEREKFREEMYTFEDFIKGLNLEVSIRPVLCEEMERVAELTKRTNQFNVSANKRSANEIGQILKNGYECSVVYVKDRFGEYGLTGTIIFSNNEKFTIDTFLLSCRVLGRGVEYEMLSYIGKVASQDGFKEIVFKYKDNNKNQLAFNFLRSIHSYKQYNTNSGIVITIKTLEVCQASFNCNKVNNDKNNLMPPKKVFDPVNDFTQDKLKVLSEVDSPEKILKTIDTRCNIPKNLMHENNHADLQQGIKEILKQMFKDVLQVAVVDKDDNFFLLGGDSLSAVKLASRIYSAFGIELSVSDFYDNQTVSKLEYVIKSGLGSVENVEEEILELDDFLKNCPAKLENMYPLSFSQEALWHFEQIFPQSWIYNMPLVLHAKGVLNIDALNYAFNKLIKQHEALRTVFIQEQGIPYQIIKDGIEINIHIENKEEASIQEIEELIRTEETIKFDLSTGPLIRARVLKLNDRESLILLTIHHIIFDGWSYSILFKDLSNFYNEYISGSLQSLRPLPLRFVDYIAWEKEYAQSKRVQQQIEYWKKQLSGLKLYEIPRDNIDINTKTYNGLYLSVKLEENSVNRLQQLCLEYSTSLFTALITIYDLLIYSLTRIVDIAIGTIIATRKSQELENLIGFFINALVIRSDLSNNPTFKNILLRNRTIVLEAFDNKDASFGEVINAAANDMPEDKNNPFYQSMFVFQNTPNSDLMMEGVTIKKYRDGYNIARSDLILELEEKHNQVFGGFYYNANYFKTETVESFAIIFDNILKNVTDNPDITIENIINSIMSDK